MDLDFRTESLPDLADAVRTRRISARELTDHALERIDALNSRVNAFVAVDPDAARAAADDVDRRVAAGEEVGPLAGVPIGVKDLEEQSRPSRISSRSTPSRPCGGLTGVP